jgi:hypothetical protein
MAWAEDALDLVAICAMVLALASVYAAKGIVNALARAFTGLPVVGHYFKSVAASTLNEINGFLDDTIKALEKHIVALLYGLLDSVAVVVALFLLPYLGVKAALEYMRDHWIVPRVDGIVRPIRDTANAAKSAAKDLADEFNTLEKTMDYQIGITASAVYNTLIGTVEREIDQLRTGIGNDVATLQSSIDRAAERAIETARTESGDAIDALRSSEDAAIQAARQAEDLTHAELQNLIRDISFGDLAAVAAAVPILTTLVQTLEDETGLGRAECRAKVRGICGTDPLSWASLLEGLAPLVIAFSLRDIVDTARPLIRETVDLVESVG